MSRTDTLHRYVHGQSNCLDGSCHAKCMICQSNQCIFVFSVSPEVQYKLARRQSLRWSSCACTLYKHCYARLSQQIVLEHPVSIRANRYPGEKRPQNPLFRAEEGISLRTPPPLTGRFSSASSSSSRMIFFPSVLYCVSVRSWLRAHIVEWWSGPAKMPRTYRFLLLFGTIGLSSSSSSSVSDPPSLLFPSRSRNGR